jgi:hypothetical protein
VLEPPESLQARIAEYAAARKDRGAQPEPAIQGSRPQFNPLRSDAVVDLPALGLPRSNSTTACETPKVQPARDKPMDRCYRDDNVESTLSSALWLLVLQYAAVEFDVVVVQIFLVISVVGVLLASLAIIWHLSNSPKECKSDVV